MIFIKLVLQIWQAYAFIFWSVFVFSSLTFCSCLYFGGVIILAILTFAIDRYTGRMIVAKSALALVFLHRQLLSCVHLTIIAMPWLKSYKRYRLPSETTPAMVDSWLFSFLRLCYSSSTL